MISVKLKRAPAGSGKKYIAIINGKRIRFGAEGYSDYTIHKDPERKRRYIARHGNTNQDWSITGVLTPGFWSRWLLWNKPSVADAIKDIESRFTISFD